MATYTAQNTTYNIPEVGEVFKDLNDPYGETIFRRTANGIEQVNLRDLIPGGYTNTKQLSSQLESAKAALKSTYGIDYNTLAGWNMGDVTQAIAVPMQNVGIGGLTNFKTSAITPGVNVNAMQDVLAAQGLSAGSPVPGATVGANIVNNPAIAPQSTLSSVASNLSDIQNRINELSGKPISSDLVSGGTTTPYVSGSPSNYDYTSLIQGLLGQTNLGTMAGTTGDAYALGTQGQKAQTMNERLQELNRQLLGESAFTSEQQQAQGVSEAENTQKDIENQILTLSRESQALKNAAAYTIPNMMQEYASSRLMTDAGLAPISASAMRKNQIAQGALASQALVLSASLDAANLRVETAKKKVEEAVAKKYDPIKEEIAVTKANLELAQSSPAYTAEEKKQAAAQLEIQNAKQAALDAAEKEQSKIYDILLTVAKNGANSTTIANISKATSALQALQIAEQSGALVEKEKTTGVVAEYEYYAQQERAMGRTPVSFNEYQNMDANRKALASGTVDLSGMTSKQQQQFLSITNKFQADSIMATANNATSARTIADQVIANPNSAGNQLTILYTLVKNLDPNSAVREGELALAQQTQSYLSKFQTSLERIAVGKPISASAAVELANATKNLANIWEAAGLRRENQYKSQANVVGVGSAFNEYLGGFNRTYEQPQSNIQTNNQIVTPPTTNLTQPQTSIWGKIGNWLFGED